MITIKEIQDGLNHFKGDDHRAWHAFCHFNMIKDMYKDFDSSTKVATMEFFYNCVFGKGVHTILFYLIAVHRLLRFLE